MDITQYRVDYVHERGAVSPAEDYLFSVKEDRTNYLDSWDESIMRIIKSRDREGGLYKDDTLDPSSYGDASIIIHDWSYGPYPIDWSILPNLNLALRKS